MTLRILAALGAAAAITCSAETPGDRFEQSVRPFLAKHCAACHNNASRTADVSFEFRSANEAARSSDLWSRAEEKIRTGKMPPAGRPRPAADEMQAALLWMKKAAALPALPSKADPGRVTVRRLNRAEYDNTVRDLFGVPVRIAADFPADDSGYGFDNIGDVLTLPPLLMENYLRAAGEVASLIVPTGPRRKPSLVRYLSDNKEQSRRVEYDDPAGYPYPPGAFEAKHFFPVDGKYQLMLRVKDRRREKKPGVPLRFYFDGEEIGRYEIEDGEYIKGDFVLRRFVSAGEHTLYGMFPKEFVNVEPWDEKLFGKALHKFERRIFVDQFEIQGPFNYDGQASAAYRGLFTCEEETEDCARRIFAPVARRAFRRPATPSEVEQLVKLVRLARGNGDSFQAGVQLALKAMLVSPQFLFRIERDPAGAAGPHPVSDLELASRLSYFLWSSMPDEALLKAAESNRLHEPAELDAQVRRMIRDPKSAALVKNFAGQWLQLRNLGKIAPDPGLFPAFNAQLRESMVRETEMYFEQLMREDRSILEFIDSNYSYLNARLAKHYGIDGVEGREMRRVELKSKERGGVVTQASVLTVSSYPTRTSPVLRGLWVLENFLGAPPPPPPAGVPALDEKKIGLELPLRKQLEQHRANPACAVCHIRMDAIGFGLENFDPTGAWRTHDGKFPIDSAGTLPGDKTFTGPAGLKQILLEDKEAFARTVAAKMLTFAVGRGMESYDRAAIQRIAEATAANGYRFSTLVTQIVQSAPFQMRRGEETRQ